VLFLSFPTIVALQEQNDQIQMRAIQCNLHSVNEMTITEPGTIDDLVADAAGRGHAITVRMIRHWTAAGLLDSPQRRPAGKGHGSRPALYQ
jgi:hypothetical protein